GRLPVTFYRGMDQVPEFTDYRMEGRTYRFLKDAPAYPFGYGLSYTRFAYEGLTAAAREGGLDLTFVVRNVGDRDGREVAQAYVRWIDPAWRTPLRQLGAFKAVFLEAGAAQTLTLRIEPEQLAVYDEEGVPHPHAGALEVYVGGGQPDARTLALTGNAPLSVRVNLA
ncbi:MAG TPA: fibronectin type III-like domain-contianing protein, partial [Clostridia bacterium]|nr:fibronectin type III-like domain-contianing protein [Clostridia bacterium]